MARNTILLRDAGHVEIGGDFSAQTRPGMLVELDGSGEWQPHATAAGAAAPLFAREQHENQGADVDDNIAANDTGTVLACASGCVVYAVTADTIAEAGWVESTGDGTVRAHASGYRIGYALEASDLSGSVGRVKIVVATSGV